MSQPRKSIIDALASALQMLAGLIILATAIGVTANAVMRYSVGRDLSLVTELGGFVFLFVIFLGLAGTFLAGSHVSVELLSAIAPERFARWFETTVVPILCLVFVTALVVTSSLMTLRYFHSGRVTIGHYPLPYWAVIGVIPIGAMMLELVLLRIIFRRFRGQ